MVERPILFTDAMVRAILEGRKTQTRRPVKGSVTPRPGERLSYCVSSTDRSSRDAWFIGWPDADGDAFTERGREVRWGPFRPPCKAGDRLWVRECFATDVDGCERGLSYRADHRDPRGDGPANPMRWRPSIHMPRWASRLTLEVLEVRIERLHEITEDDAKAEGLKAMTKDGSLFKWGIPDRDGWPGRDDDGWAWHDWCRAPRDAFKHLWRSIYGTGTERGDHGWDANPLVWVCTFKVMEVARG